MVRTHSSGARWTALVLGFALVTTLGGNARAATIQVDDDLVECPTAAFTSINAAIAAASPGDTIEVCPGTYAENVVVTKALTLKGAQFGVDARGRVASESIVAPPGGIGINLQVLLGSTTIDGFTISGGARGIESTAGVLDDLVLANNRVLGFTNAAFFLNNNGPNATLHRNAIDGASKVGGGGIVHLDTDNFDGLHFTENTISGNGNGTGLFVDGNHNVGATLVRPPLIDGNVVDGAGTGMNLGTRAFEFGTISANEFTDNVFDGLQGGIQNSVVSGNKFLNNGRSGLALTSFGNMGLDRGAQNTDVLDNEFSGNQREAIFFSATQAPGTISTNEAHGNNIDGNTDGVVYGGTETIDVECNWWGSFSGPSGDGPGTGDSAVAPLGSFDFEPWLTGPAPGGACNGPLSTNELKQAVRGELAAMVPTGDAADDRRIEKAVEHLDRSLEASLWVSDERLDAKKGDRVFEEERKAVQELVKVVNTDVSGQIGTILDVDRKLADTAIDDATGTPVVNPKRASRVASEIAKANEELQAGDDARTAGLFVRAVERYREAWRHAQQAIAEATKP